MGFKGVKCTTTAILSFLFWGRNNEQLNALLLKTKINCHGWHEKWMTGWHDYESKKESGEGLMMDGLPMMANGWWAYRVAEKKL